MAATRPPRTPSESTQSDGLVEQVLAQLKDLNGKINELAEGHKLLRVNLLGGVGADTEHGRLPKVETDLKELTARVKVLEAAQIQWKAYAAAAAAIGGFMGGLIALVTKILSAVLK